MARRKNEKPIIAIDLDDTVFHTIKYVWKIHCQLKGIHPDSPARKEFNLHQLWASDAEYCMRLLDTHFNLHAQKPRLIRGAKRALLQLSLEYRLAAVTARCTCWFPQTLSQIRTIGCDFHQVHLCTDNNRRYTSKALVCKEHGYPIIIDDHLSNALECAAAGMDAYVFGTNSQNSRENLPTRVRFVNDWPHLYRQIIANHRA